MVRFSELITKAVGRAACVLDLGFLGGVASSETRRWGGEVLSIEKRVRGC